MFEKMRGVWTRAIEPLVLKLGNLDPSVLTWGSLVVALLAFYILSDAGLDDNGAMMIGVIAAIVCRIGGGLAARWIDDPAGVFVVHGLGGLTGVLLLPIFVLPLLGGVGYEVPVSLSAALLSQLAGLAIVALWAMIGTAIAALIVSMVIPMRVGAQEEADGLDASQHGHKARVGQ